jgi:hypothetical protein
MKTCIKQRSKTIPADLLRLKEQFEHWRQTRSGKNNTPPELMSAAVKLLLKHPVTLVSRQLGLNHTTLKAWGKIATLPVTQALERFVEITPSLPKQEASYLKPKAVQVYCELEGLKIFLSAPQAHDWENLISGVLSATRSVQVAV